MQKPKNEKKKQNNLQKGSHFLKRQTTIFGFIIIDSVSRFCDKRIEKIFKKKNEKWKRTDDIDYQSFFKTF